MSKVLKNFSTQLWRENCEINDQETTSGTNKGLKLDQLVLHAVCVRLLCKALACVRRWCSAPCVAGAGGLTPSVSTLFPEEAVNEVKRQAMSELQKAVSEAERKAHEMISSERAKMERTVAEAKRQAAEDALSIINQQEDSSEVGPAPMLGHDHVATLRVYFVFCRGDYNKGVIMILLYSSNNIIIITYI